MHVVIRSEALIVANRITGTVLRFDGSKGYGYIQAEKGLEVFVHYTAIQGNGIKTLAAGEKVEFVLEESYRGPQAQEVVRLA